MNVIYLRIDIHCHIFSEQNTTKFIDKIFQGFTGYGFYKQIKSELKKVPSVEADSMFEKTLAHIKNAGLNKVVLLPLSLRENLLVKEWSELEPNIFIPFLNPPEKKSYNQNLYKYFSDQIESIEYRGFKITNSFRKKKLNDPILKNVFKVAQDYNLPILMHTGYPPPGTKKNVLSYSNPFKIEEFALQFPEVNIIIAHMGYPWVDIALSLAVQYQNVYLDISNLTYMMPNRLKEFLLRAKELIGLDKILFGSDGFIPEMIEMTVNLFEGVDFLRKEEKSKILGENSGELLNII
ncbi:MAG: amidohydrolase family protein [Candidatus Lokiarchaeota archaeon]|nr:amidohydrolase family protein [Candidatus Lokiarchaeota archaeon]MBD3201922.1 amidohydrolase family protein [Candidatus Lokiarchaeota archaeon]